MKKSNAEILFENANAGFKEFEEKILNLRKKDIFNKAYEINAKNEIHGYLCDCAEGDLTEDEIKVLAGLGDAVIEELYDYFQGNDSASIMFYSEISYWVRDFCEEAIKDEI